MSLLPPDSNDETFEDPPQNLEAEHFLLGQIICNPELAWEARSLGLTAEHFYDSASSAIYAAVLKADDEGGFQGLPSIAHRLSGCRDHLLLAGDLAADQKHMRPYVERLAGIVMYNERLRRMLTTAESIPAILRRPSLDPASEAEAAWAAGAAEVDKDDGMLTSRDGVRAFRERRLSPAPEVVGFPVGIPELDAFGALSPGDLTIVAGRPSMGKSAFATSIAGLLAVAGVPTMFISLEVSNERTMANTICARAGVPHDEIRLGSQALEDAEEELASAPLWFEDPGQLTAERLRAKIRIEAQRKGVKVVIVDYLQLLTPTAEAAKRSRNDEVSEMSRLLKVAAMESKVSVISLCQLNRGVESRREKMPDGRTAIGLPRLSDLRDSGSIEQDADRVWLLYRKSYYDQAVHDPRIAEEASVIVAKNRNGSTGVCSLHFTPACTAFSSKSIGVYARGNGYQGSVRPIGEADPPVI